MQVADGSQTLLIDRFEGGTHQVSTTRLAPGECYSTAGCWHVEGTLRSAEGRNLIGSAQIVANKPIWASHRYYAESGGKRGYTLAKCDTAVWIDISSDDTGNYRPLLANCYRDGSNAYLASRTDGIKEFFCQVGKYLYITYGDQVNGESVRWDGFFYASGAVSCLTADLTLVTGSGTDFSSADVKQGDTIYFYDHAGSAWQLGAGARTIKRVTDGTHLVLDGNGFDTTGKGAGGGNSVNYIIVRAHKMGVTAATTCTAGAATAGGSLTPSTTYYFKYRYKNSLTGYTGNISGAGSAATTDVNKTIPLSGWSTRPIDRQINQLEIFSSTDGATYQLHATLTAGATDYAFPASYDATANPAATATVLEADAAYHDVPPDRFGKLIHWNGKLWARRTGTYANRLHFSTTWGYEYWPTLLIASDDPSSTMPYAGGYILVGSAGDYIMDYAPEGGAYSTTGEAGSNLLVWTFTRAFRFFGASWLDFQLVEAFHVGAVSNRVAVNCAGLVCWLSRDGPMLIEPGSNVPTPIYRALWPKGLHEYLSGTSTDTLLAQAVAIYWNGYYILALGTAADTKNTQLWAFHLATRTWTPMHTSSAAINVASLAACDGPTDREQLLMGDGAYGYVWRLFAKTGTHTYWTPSTSAGVPTEIKLPLLSLSPRPEDRYTVKHIERVIACYKAPAAQQTVTLSVYTNGQDTGTPSYSDTATVAADSSTHKRQYAIWYPSKSGSFPDGRLFWLWLTGTFTAEMELEWVQIRFRLHGESPGQAVE